MPRYLLNIWGPDAPPPPEVMARMGEIMGNMHALVDDLKSSGAWVFNGGLHNPSTSTVVRSQNGDILITDGPYVEAKEHIGGFLIIEAADLDAALSWARRLASIVEALPIEVRPFQDEPGRNA